MSINYLPRYEINSLGNDKKKMDEAYPERYAKEQKKKIAKMVNKHYCWMAGKYCRLCGKKEIYE